MSRRSGGSIGAGAAIMAAGTAVSRVLGMVRNMVLIWVIGTVSLAANAFQLANSLPTYLYNLLISGGLTAVLVPQVVRAYKRGDGQEYVNRLLSLGFLLLIGLTVVLTAAVPLVVMLYGLGDGSPDRLGLAIAFAWWTMPQLFFYGMYALLGQVLNARGSFGPFMWAPAANNVVSIATLVLFIVMFGAWQDDAPEAWSGGQIAVLAGGATLGIVAQALFLLPAMRRAGLHFRFRWGYRGVGLGAAGAATLWTFVALLIGQVGIIAVSQAANAATDAVGNTAVVAGQAAYANAFMIFMLPHSLITLSLITALFPRMSAQAADRDHGAVAHTLSKGMRVVGLFTLLAGALGVLLADPLVRVVLPTASTEAVPVIGQVLAAFMIGLPAFGIWSVAQRVYYANENARGLVPVAIGMAAVVLLGTVGVRLLLPPSLWVVGAALAMSASYLLASGMTLVGLKQRLGTVGGSAMLRTYLRANIAVLLAAGAGLIALLSLRMVGLVESAGLSAGLTGLQPWWLWRWAAALAVCVIVGAVTTAVYVLVLKSLRVSELDLLLRGVRRMTHRLRRSRSG
ncbi:MAG: murein biosynthesis integral membrane protein MurJ [Micrococcales bacterium]|nr:murein biosynthesis integral membrane protein MurJ [Micrococcales bacterium]